MKKSMRLYYGVVAAVLLTATVLFVVHAAQPSRHGFILHQRETTFYRDGTIEETVMSDVSYSAGGSTFEVKQRPDGKTQRFLSSVADGTVYALSKDKATRLRAYRSRADVAYPGPVEDVDGIPAVKVSPTEADASPGKFYAVFWVAPSLQNSVVRFEEYGPDGSLTYKRETLGVDNAEPPASLFKLSAVPVEDLKR
jgi:hypothetical protein